MIEALLCPGKQLLALYILQLLQSEFMDWWKPPMLCWQVNSTAVIPQSMVLVLN